jgi:hypothetical protein
MKISSAVVFASLLIILSAVIVTRAQDAPPLSQPEKLADLIAEAERNNPQIQAARHGWQSAQDIPTQVSTRPDPQFVLQHVSVGSPGHSRDIRTAISLTWGSAFRKIFPIPENFACAGISPKKMPR